MGIVEKYRGYDEFIFALKHRIQSAQIKAVSAVNAELLNLYWHIGNDILERQEKEGWGAGVIARLAQDLKTALPRQTGYSPRNLKYMRSFARLWKNPEIVQAPLAQLSWYHHVALIDKLSTPEERLWYSQKTVEHGWSRNILVIQIESGLIRRQGQATTNFHDINCIVTWL